MAWGRINTNSSSSKNDVSYFTKLNEIDYTNDTASMPSRFLFVKNNEELYFIDANNIIKILNLSKGTTRSTGREVETGSTHSNDKYFLIGNKYLYSKSTLSKLAELNPTGSGSGSYLTSMNYDGDIYMLFYPTSDTSQIKLYKVNSDFSSSLIMTCSNTGWTLTKMYNVQFVVDKKDNVLRVLFTNSPTTYYKEFNLSTGTVITSSTCTFGSDSNTHYFYTLSVGKNVLRSDSYDSSNTYTTLSNGTLTIKFNGYWEKIIRNIYPYSVLTNTSLYIGNPDTDDISRIKFPSGIKPVFLDGKILVHKDDNVFKYYNIGEL